MCYREVERLLATRELFRTRLIFCDMPGITPRATIGAKIFWRVGRGDFVGGCGQSFAFGGVLAFAGYGAF
jgi:hypothetical protein